MSRTSKILSQAKGRKTVQHIEDGKAYVEHWQDVEGISDWCAEVRQFEQDGDSALGTLVAAIPKETLNRAFIEGWFHDPQAWERWYADNPQFHTTDKYKTI